MTILKIGAVWCPGCIVMRPIWEEIEREMPELKTEYFEYDDHPEIAEKYNIGGEIPVFIFLDQQGNEFHRIVGQKSKQEIVDFIKASQGK